MRVLLVSSSSGSRGGGEIFLLYLAGALRDCGVSPELWCASHPRMDELAARFESYGPIHRDPYPNSYLDRPTRLVGAGLDWKLSRYLAERWRAIGPDLIHLNKQTLEDGLDLVSASRRSGIPTVATIHITQSNRELKAVAGEIRDQLSRRALRRAEDLPLTAVSDLRGADLAAFTGRQVSVIYNAVPPHVEFPDHGGTLREELLTKNRWSPDSLIALCVARLVPQKDPLRFLRLAQKLHQRDPRWRFVWVGEGSYHEEFRSNMAKLGMTEMVAITGWQKEPRTYLSCADLYLHPAAYEGLPLAILEAMSASLPCVISPAIANEVRAFDSSSVIICDEEHDDWMLASCDEASRAAYARQGRRLYEAHFQPHAMASAYRDLYRQTMNTLAITR